MRSSLYSPLKSVIVRGRSLGGVMCGLVSLLLLTACGGGAKEDNSPEFQASLAAKQYYEALYVGNRAETFLNGRADAHAMPADFRQQLLEDYEDHRRQVEREHQGVKAVDVVRAEMDLSLGLMQVFLSFTYADGQHEEVVVPMIVDGDGRWRMK